MASRIDEMTTAPPRLLITRRLPDAVLARARLLFETTVFLEDRPIGDDFERLASGQDALLVMATDRVDETRLAALCPTLRALATYSAGHDHIDLGAATRARIPVFTTPDVLSESVAEIALYLILAAARRTRVAENVLRSGAWGPWSPTAMVGMQLTGKRLGIYGMGAIGRAVAARARGFGLEIHYFNRRRLAPALEEGARHHATLESLLGASDVLCVAAPSTDETRNSLDGRRLALLPRGAILVNVARGDLVDEEAVFALTKSGHLGPVGLDVFRNEPHIDPRWLQLPDAALLPHIGSATDEARVGMGLRALAGLERHFEGSVAPNCINPGVYDASEARLTPKRQEHHESL
jgi:lactate dehydrogenase-like 2-hydroxyacid dehydrogenase